MKNLFLFLIFTIFLISFTSAIYETASISNAYTSTATQTVDKGMVLNITNSSTNTYRIVNVTKYAGVSATVVQLCYDLLCSKGIANATFYGNIANFNTTNVYLNASTKFYLNTERSSIDHKFVFGASYPTPASNSYVKFIGSNNDGSLDTNYYIDFNGVTVEVSSPSTINTVLNTPLNGTTASDTGLNFTATYTPTIMNLTNATYYVWYNNGTLFNKTTVSVTGNNTNSTTLFIDNFIVGDKYIWNVLACGTNSTTTFCAYASNNNSITVSYSVLGVTYNNNTYPINIESFSFSLSTIALNSVVGNLIYNGTSYTSKAICSGSVCTLSNTISIPNTNVATTNSFYWNFTVYTSTGSINFLSNVYNQSVIPVLFDNCQSYTNRLFNITNFDQDSLTRLTQNTYNVQIRLGDNNLNNYISYSNNFSNMTNALICLSNLSSTYRMDAIIQTVRPGYYTQFYNYQNYTLTNQTMNINLSLYQLNVSSGQQFQINIKDSNYLQLKNAIVEIDRQYVQNGNFLAVEIPLTDSFGSTIGHFVLNNQLYNIYIKQNGVLIASFLNQQIYCNPLLTDCILTYNLPGTIVEPTPVAGDSGIYYSNQNYNDTTKTYSFDFNSVDGTPKTVLITGTYTTAYTTQQVCSQTVVASSGHIYCDITGVNNVTVLIQAYANGDNIFNDNVQVSYSKQNILSKSRYVLGAFLIPVAVLMAGSSASLAVIAFIIGIIVCAVIFVIDTQSLIGPSSFIVWFALAGILLIWKIVKGGVKNG